MTKWVRSGVLEGAGELVAQLGGDYRALALRAGLPAAALSNPDLPVRVDAFVRFLDSASASLGEEAFGLRLGISQTLGLFGPMATLLNSATTVEGMLHDLVDYFPLHTQGAIIGLVRDPAGLMLTYELSSGVRELQRQVIELGFGVLLSELRRHRPDWSPHEVYLRHGAPANRTWHRRLLGSNVTYDADRNAILFETDLLVCPTAEGNRALHDPLAADYAAAARSAVGMDANRTEALVRLHLPFSPVDIDVVARTLRRSRRTLQRRLEDEGSSFARILDEVRAGLARSYLVESNLTVAEIAEVLQFSETSALSRASQRWWGLSPRELRRSGKPMRSL
jgi:AraC-like DNA-binding protein